MEDHSSRLGDHGRYPATGSFIRTAGRLKDLSVENIPSIYQTTGCVEPAPYGLFDDEYRLTTSSGDGYHMWSEELNHLLSAVHKFQWVRKKIPLPELPIVTDWNMIKGVFDMYANPLDLVDSPRFIAALRVLRENYADYESDGEGFVALSMNDLDALITFLTNAQACDQTVTITED